MRLERRVRSFKSSVERMSPAQIWSIITKRNNSYFARDKNRILYKI